MKKKIKYFLLMLFKKSTLNTFFIIITLINNVAYPHKLKDITPFQFSLLAEYIYETYETNKINTQWHKKLYNSYQKILSKIDKKKCSSFELKKYGMATEYLDFMATEYAKIKKNTFITVLFPPTSLHPQTALKTISDFGDLVYIKQLSLNVKGLYNLIDRLYEVHHADGWHQKLVEMHNRFKSILKNPGEVLIILWECSSWEKSVNCKRKIRSLYDNRNNTVCHFTDKHFETCYASQAFFSHNTVKFLNSTRPKIFKNFKKYAMAFQSILRKKPHLQDIYCIDAGGVLAAYGLRDCGDFDIIDNANFPIPFPNLGRNNVTREKYGFNIDDLIYNPNNFFYYKGLRFLNLDLVLLYKERKQSKKDIKDINIINSFLSKTSPNHIT